MKKLSKYFSLSKGFSLIELIVVFSILSVLSTVSIASFVDYSRKQALNTAVLDVVSMLQNARSRAQSQVKNSTSCTTLNGYRVDISTVGNYTLYAVCDSVPPIETEAKILPSGISFTTSAEIFFQVLSGQVTGFEDIEVEGYDMTKIIQVDSVGNVIITTPTPAP